MLPLRNFKAYINQHALFTEQHKILLAVSGGKDSVLMAHLFKLSGFNFGIAHCNFNLRADESQRDESFVKLLALTLDVPYYVTHFKTKDFAAVHKVSTQMAARILRYDWFEELRIREGYDYIALAQHQDDAVETVLLNLTRGTGIAGLHGIFPKRARLIRPLLFLSATEIAALVDEHHIDYVEDSSNQSTHYARNKIRLNVIPQLKEINPNLEETFRHNIQRFSETELVLRQVVAAVKQRIVEERQGKFYVSIAEINLLQPKQLLLFELLRDFGFSESVTAELITALEKQSGTCFYSNSHRAVVDRENLIIDAIADQETIIRNMLIHPDDSVLDFPGYQLWITSVSDLSFKRDLSMAYVDADKLIFPLIWRGWQHGDKFRPIGMTGSKNLSDFFIDEKVPLSVKDEVPVLVNGNGEIIWIVGLRQDDRYKLTENTSRVTIFELRNLHITISKQS